MQQRLAGKIALITGAASGIGYATAGRFVADGATVVLTDLSKERLAASFSQVCGHGGLHRALDFDVTDEQGWIRAMEEVESAYGRLDVLVNNAGQVKVRSIANTTLQEWRGDITVNLDSVFLGTKYSIPLLTRSGKGSIINVSSIGGLVSVPNTGAYGAAKAGVRLFTKTTALECAAAQNGIRANSVHPGHIETPLFTQHLNPARVPDLLARIPLGRFGQAWEIAATIAFLASDESSYITGAEVILDGGYTAQ